MISFFETEILDVHVHRVGNKAMDEGVSFAEKATLIQDEFMPHLAMMFLSKFQKSTFNYRLFHPSGCIDNNVIHSIIHQPGTSVSERSKLIARHLYDSCDHPKIKGGELFAAEFVNIQFQGELLNAIGLFKSENKEMFIKSIRNYPSFELQFVGDAFGIDRLDKGALLLDNGTVLCYDNDKTGYWRDQFLMVEVLKDDFSNTSNALEVVKEFITHKLDEEFEIGSTDKIDLLNKSISYFKDRESFDVEEFCNDVLRNETAISKFKDYRSIYGEEFDELPDSFNISTAAVKKQAKGFKKVIKLDKNFHIYVHGNKELIEKDYDREKGMNFYKVYYKEEL